MSDLQQLAIQWTRPMEEDELLDVLASQTRVSNVVHPLTHVHCLQDLAKLDSKQSAGLDQIVAVWKLAIQSHKRKHHSISNISGEAAHVVPIESGPIADDNDSDNERQQQPIKRRKRLRKLVDESEEDEKEKEDKGKEEKSASPMDMDVDVDDVKLSMDNDAEVQIPIEADEKDKETDSAVQWLNEPIATRRRYKDGRKYYRKALVHKRWLVAPGCFVHLASACLKREDSETKIDKRERLVARVDELLERDGQAVAGITWLYQGHELKGVKPALKREFNIRTFRDYCLTDSRSTVSLSYVVAVVDADKLCLQCEYRVEDQVLDWYVEEEHRVRFRREEIDCLRDCLALHDQVEFQSQSSFWKRCHDRLLKPLQSSIGADGNPQRSLLEAANYQFVFFRMAESVTRTCFFCNISRACTYKVATAAEPDKILGMVGRNCQERVERVGLFLNQLSRFGARYREAKGRVGDKEMATMLLVLSDLVDSSDGAMAYTHRLDHIPNGDLAHLHMTSSDDEKEEKEEKEETKEKSVIDLRDSETEENESKSTSSSALVMDLVYVNDSDTESEADPEPIVHEKEHDGSGLDTKHVDSFASTSVSTGDEKKKEEEEAKDKDAAEQQPIRKSTRMLRPVTRRHHS